MGKSGVSADLGTRTAETLKLNLLKTNFTFSGVRRLPPVYTNTTPSCFSHNLSREGPLKEKAELHRPKKKSNSSTFPSKHELLVQNVLRLCFLQISGIRTPLALVQKKQDKPINSV